MVPPGGQNGGDPNEIDADEEREQFLRLNIERVEQAYLRAVEEKIEAPIAMLMDNRDETAQSIVAAVPDLVGTGEVADENPASLFVMSAEDVIERLEPVHPPLRFFVEHTMKMRQALGTSRRFVVFLMISFGKIDCKLHALPD